MTDTVTTQRNDEALKSLIASIVSSVGSSLGDLVDRQLQILPGQSMQEVEVEDWLGAIDGTKAVVRGDLVEEFADRNLLLAIDLAEAITLAGCHMMTPEEVIDEHRTAETLDSDQLEAFSEVANVLCSGIDGTLRDSLGDRAGLRVKDTALVKPGADAEEILGKGAAVIYDFSVQIGDHPASEAWLLVDPETAQAWNNDQQLFKQPQGEEVAEAEGSSEAVDPAKPLEIEEEDEEIPQAPIRATLSAFLAGPAASSEIRKCGRRIGLEIQRYARTDIPNPSAHRGQIVLIEVPVGEEKRFDWARRIKQHHRDIPVALLIHQPSRSRVVKGFMTKADIILAWPSREQQLSAKLEPLIDHCASEHDPED